MENFKHLDAKTIELAGISASIAGGCRPCLDYHFKKALELGCTKEQAEEAIELGKMIKQRPINDIYEHAEKLMNTNSNNQSFKIL
jgi:AhpD family alkylhydroperoxidase